MTRRLLNVGRWLVALVSLIGAIALWATSDRHIRGIRVYDRTADIVLCVGRGDLFLAYVWSEPFPHPPATKPTKRDYFLSATLWTEPPQEERNSDEYDYPVFVRALGPRWEFAGLSYRTGSTGTKRYYNRALHRALVLPMWLVTLALLPPPLIMAARLIRTRRRRQLGLCLRCGYDLRGSKDSARCPECGGAAAAGSAGDVSS